MTEVILKGAALNPPDGFSAEAVKVWEQTIPVMVALWGDKPVDRDALATYCESSAQLLAACQTAGREGTIIPGEDGFPKQHPAITEALRLSRELPPLMRKLGLPSRRGRRPGSPAPTRRGSQS